MKKFLRILFQFILVAVVIASGAAFARYMIETKPKVEARKIAERVWTVDSVKVRANKSITPRLNLYGTIVPGREVELRPLVAGRVVAVGKSFAEGGLVHKGELLIRIDPFEYEARVKEAKAHLREARARMKEIVGDLAGEKALLEQDKEDRALREREVERRTNLRKSGSGSQKALDDSIIALNQVQQRLADRQKRINALEARKEQQDAGITKAEVALARAERDLTETELRAPVDGILRSVANTAVGKKVSTQDLIARLTDAKTLEADFLLTEEQYARLVSDGKVIGRPVKIVWKTDARKFEFDAVIRRTSGRISSTDGGIGVFARIVGSSLDTVLRPGVFVEVSLDDKVYRDVYRIPDEAVHGSDTIYAIVDGRLKSRSISIVGRIGNDVLIRGALADGEEIVATTFPEIGPGVKVQVR